MLYSYVITFYFFEWYEVFSQEECVFVLGRNLLLDITLQ